MSCLMTPDEALIAQRRAEDEMNYLLHVTDHEKAPRLAPGMCALRARLIAERELPWAGAVAEVLRHSDLAVKTADTMLRKLITGGFLRREGDYSRTYNRRGRAWKVSDTRVVQLVDWPTHEETKDDLHS